MDQTLTQFLTLLGGAALMFALAPQSPRLPALGNLAELAFSYAMISGELVARRAEAARLALKTEGLK